MRKDNNLRRRERGFSLIELMIVIAIIGILVGVGVPTWKNSVITGNETAAIGTLKNISKEQRTFYIRRGQFGTFDELIAAGALDERFAGEAPSQAGYTFTIKVTPKTPTAPAGYVVNADPLEGGALSPTGERHFYMDSNSDVVRFTKDRQATVSDPPVSN